MNEQPARRDLIWMVCEEGDRWYRAICRFASEPMPLAPETCGGQHRWSVERFGNQPAKLAAAVNRQAGGPIVVLWELQTVDPAALLDRLDWIATIRSEAKEVFQTAWLPSGTAAELFLIAREAGIATFLENTHSLQHLGKRLALG